MTKLSDQDLPLHGPTDDAGDGQVVDEVKARQGFRGRHALVILICSVGLAAIVLFGLWGLNSGSLGGVSRGDHPAAATAKTP
jgi:hypothetical protein